MSKKYYAWKNADCNGKNPEWIEMTGKEFLEFKRNPSNKHRLFVQVDAEYENEDVIFLEANENEYRKWNKAHSQHIRDKKLKEKSGFSTISFEMATEDGLTIGDLLASDEDVENAVMESMRFEALRKAIAQLLPEEKKIINTLYFHGHKVSEREGAKLLGIPQKTLNNRKKKIFEKIRLFLAQNK